MVVGVTTTCVISAYHHQCCELYSFLGEVYSIQHHDIKFVSELWQVIGFLRVLWFPEPIKRPTRYNCNIIESGVNTTTLALNNKVCTFINSCYKEY